MPFLAFRAPTTWALLFCTLLLASRAGAQPATPAGRDSPPGDRPIVMEMRFDGAAAFDASTLKRVVRSEEAGCRLVLIAPVCLLYPGKVVFDIERLDRGRAGDDIDRLRVWYWQQGYRAAKVDTATAPKGRGIALTFRITEGEPVRVGPITVEGATPLDTAQVRGLVRLREGAPLNMFQLDSTLSGLRDALWDLGYADAVVDTTVPRPDASLVVPVRITVEPRWRSRVGTIEVVGNEVLSDETVRRGLDLRPGDPFTRERVLASQRHLFRSPLVRQAFVVTPAAGDSVKTVRVTIREGAPRRIRLGGGFSTADYLQAGAMLALENVSGGTRLEARVAANNLLAEQLEGSTVFREAGAVDLAEDARRPFLKPAWQGSVSLVRPWFLTPGGTLALTGFAARRVVPGIVVEEGAGAELTLVQEIAPLFPVGLAYRVERSRVDGDDAYFCASFGVCDAGTIAGLRGRRTLAPVALTLLYDRTNDVEIPTGGFTVAAEVEHASRATGSGFGHDRASVEVSRFSQLGPPGAALALRGRAGWARARGDDDALHPRKRFYSGGGQSMRGAPENEVGPRVLLASRRALAAGGCTDATIDDGTCDPSAADATSFELRPLGGTRLLEGTVEYRLPVNRRLFAAAFVDAAWLGGDGLGDGLAELGEGSARVAPGIGFRYRSPFGILRLDIAMRAGGAERLPVLAEREDGEGVVRLQGTAVHDPLAGVNGFFPRLGRRLVVHFSLGQPF